MHLPLQIHACTEEIMPKFQWGGEKSDPMHQLQKNIMKIKNLLPGAFTRWLSIPKCWVLLHAICSLPLTIHKNILRCHCLQSPVTVSLSLLVLNDLLHLAKRDIGRSKPNCALQTCHWLENPGVPFIFMHTDIISAGVFLPFYCFNFKFSASPLPFFVWRRSPES